jgi:hypothetical protein
MSKEKQHPATINIHQLIGRVDISIHPDVDKNDLEKRLYSYIERVESCLTEAILQCLQKTVQGLEAEE